MPYIEQEYRKMFSRKLANLVEVLTRHGEEDIEGVGELNYCISSLIWRLWYDGTQSYEKANRLIGVLECVKQEFYRRHVAPYEDEKLASNGDIV